MDVALKVLVLTMSAPASMNSRWMSPISAGRVMASRSLQPLRSRGEAAKRSPRYAASSSLCCWIMVPMAPSRTTMRCLNSSRSAWARSICVMSGTGHLAFGARPHAQRVADRVGQLRTIQRIEMELLDAVALQGVHLLDGHRRGDQLARFGIVLEPVEAVLQPVRDRGAAALGELRDLRETRDGQDARHDGRVDAARRATIAKAQEQIGVVEELRDGARSAGVDLAFQIAEIEFEARCLGMAFRVRGHRDFEISNGLEAGDQVRGIGEAIGARFVFRDAGGRIAAQRDDVAD